MNDIHEKGDRNATWGPVVKLTRNDHHNVSIRLHYIEAYEDGQVNTAQTIYRVRESRVEIEKAIKRAYEEWNQK